MKSHAGSTRLGVRLHPLPALAACVVLLTACATSRLSAPSEADSAIQYLRLIMSETGSWLGTPSPEQGAGYRVLNAAFCADSQSVQNASGVRFMMQNFCNDKGGDSSGDYCMSHARPGEVLFFAHIEPNLRLCSPVNTHGVSAKVIEPSGPASDPNYRQMLVLNGYHSAEDVRREAARQQAVVDADARQRVLNLPLVEKIGARVCQDAPNTGAPGARSPVRYLGFVEGIEGDRIQIRVNSASFIGSGTPLANFMPSIIWDDAVRWTPC